MYGGEGLIGCQLAPQKASESQDGFMMPCIQTGLCWSIWGSTLVGVHLLVS